jgi:predicted TIM-barrel fold metal-dependent hydrolase
MIIDFHAHVYPPGMIDGREKYLDDQNFKLINGGVRAKMFDHFELIRNMDSSGVDKAVVMGFSWIKGDYSREQNEYHALVRDASRGRILPFGSVPLGEIKKVDPNVARIREMGFYGIGEISFYSEGMTEINEEFLRRLFESACRYELPVCLHVNEPVGHIYSGKYEPSLGRLYGIITEYSKLKLILAHWGGGMFFYELMPEVREALGGVFYDTAASPFLYSDEVYDIALRTAGADKILFGSDFPLINYGRYIRGIEKHVTEIGDRDKIFSSNALRILGIK